MTCDRCGREAATDDDGEPVFGYVHGLCLVCDDYLREREELRAYRSEDAMESEQQTL